MAAPVQAAVHQQLWVDLEIEAWEWERLQAEKPIHQKPTKSRIGLWNRLDDATKLLAVTDINNFRAAAIAEETQRRNTANTNAPVGDDLERPANIETYKSILTAYANAITHAVAMANGLIARRIGLKGDRRYVHTTTAWLTSVIDRWNQRHQLLQNQVADFAHNAATYLAEQDATYQRKHPMGSPKPLSEAESLGWQLPPPPNEDWVGGFPLGKGGQGAPVVYVTQGMHGHILDRVCVKDTQWPYIEEGIYREGTNDDGTARYNRRVHNMQWFDPNFLPRNGTGDYTNRKPAEIAALESVKGQPGSNSIVCLRNWKRVYKAAHLRYYRTYTEWCAWGNIYDLSRKYFPWAERTAQFNHNTWLRRREEWEAGREAAKRGGDEEYGEGREDEEDSDDAGGAGDGDHREDGSTENARDDRPAAAERQEFSDDEPEEFPVKEPPQSADINEDLRFYLPAPFIWSVFESLATAGLVLEQGTDEWEQVPNFSQILHMDWKPANIFLGHNSTGTYRGYPQAKLGDFGSCIILPNDKTREVDATNYMGIGTHYSQAPEQVELDPDDQSHSLSSKTNVFGLGLTMWSLLHGSWDGDFTPRGCRFPLYNNEEENAYGPVLAYPMQADFPDYIKSHPEYTDTLLNLIKVCLAFNPADRPSFRDILVEIERAVEDGNADQDMRHADVNDNRFLNEHGLKLDQEKWPRGGGIEETHGGCTESEEAEV